MPLQIKVLLWVFFNELLILKRKLHLKDPIVTFNIKIVPQGYRLESSEWNIARFEKVCNGSSAAY